MNEPAISLREYLEKIIDIKAASQDKALQLKADEVERRLAELNKLRAEVTQDRGLLVSKATYEPAHKELEKWKDETNVRLTTIETRSITWTAALGIFFTIIQVLGGVFIYLTRK